MELIEPTIIVIEMFLVRFFDLFYPNKASEVFIANPPIHVAFSFLPLFVFLR